MISHEPQQPIFRHGSLRACGAFLTCLLPPILLAACGQIGAGETGLGIAGSVHRSGHFVTIRTTLENRTSHPVCIARFSTYPAAPNDSFGLAAFVQGKEHPLPYSQNGQILAMRIPPASTLQVENTLRARPYTPGLVDLASGDPTERAEFDDALKAEMQRGQYDIRGDVSVLACPKGDVVSGPGRITYQAISPEARFHDRTFSFGTYIIR
ncbi:hypothetical protein [Chachezhania sediminis]|uniref:hypothetical protein n=1 Tax=Chachezhania sediminis TaxID=2599291 RepID=UPI00131C0099|nr:hypothetical protein [Chachezhania sediminis]